MPVPLPGYWSAPNDFDFFDACIPPEACPGFGNPCTDGYTGKKCGFCARGFYRSNTVCLACPSSVPLSLAFGSILLFAISFSIAKYGRYFQGLGMPRIVSHWAIVINDRTVSGSSSIRTTSSSPRR